MDTTLVDRHHSMNAGYSVKVSGEVHEHYTWLERSQRQARSKETESNTLHVMLQQPDQILRHLKTFEIFKCPVRSVMTGVTVVTKAQLNGRSRYNQTSHKQCHCEHFVLKRPTP